MHSILNMKGIGILLKRPSEKWKLQIHCTKLNDHIFTMRRQRILEWRSMHKLTYGLESMSISIQKMNTFLLNGSYEKTKQQIHMTIVKVTNPNAATLL